MQRIACCVGSGCSLSGHDEHGTGCSTDVTQHVTRDALRHSLGAEGWMDIFLWYRKCAPPFLVSVMIEDEPSGGCIREQSAAKQRR